MDRLPVSILSRGVNSGISSIVFAIGRRSVKAGMGSQHERLERRYAGLRPMAMIEVGRQGRRASMRRHSHTRRSKPVDWKRLMLRLGSTRPLNHHAGRETESQSRKLTQKIGVY
jgi:hypothetical protein